MAHNPCLMCKGACCEYMVLDVTHMSASGIEWAILHGREYTGFAYDPKKTIVEIDQQCRWLTMGGKCRNYEERPQVCRAFKPGNPLCIEAVKRQREQPEQNRILMQGVD
jgi:Fe-S-cluster containining protein